ncbi:MAG TPA: hypothetical protein V6D00_09010 [Pantanalinema sp.]
MKFKWAVMSAAAMLLAGCAVPLAGNLAGRDASLSVVSAVQDGGLRTQSTLTAYTKASIARVTLKLYTLDASGTPSPVMDGASQVQADVSSTAIDKPVTFKSLHRKTTYRIKAFAYKGTSEATDDLISTTDANSYRTIRVDRSLTPTITSVPVKLIDRLFKAEGTSSLEVTDGTITHETESIVPGT